MPTPAVTDAITKLEARLLAGIAESKERHRQAALRRTDYTPVADEEVMWISRPHRCWKKVMREAADVMVTRIENGAYDRATSAHRRSWSDSSGSDDYTLHVAINTTGWGEVTEADRAEYEMQQDVRKAEQEVALVNNASNRTALRIAAWGEAQDAMAVAVKAAWDYLQGMRDATPAIPRDTIIRTRQKVGQIQRDVQHAHAGMRDEDIMYLIQSLQNVSTPETRYAVDMVREWNSAKRGERHQWDYVDTHLADDDEDQPNWDLESIPGWDAPIGTAEWLDAITETVKRVKA